MVSPKRLPFFGPAIRKLNATTKVQAVLPTMTLGASYRVTYAGRDLLEQAIRREEANSEPDHIWAEVVYLPRKVRAANVAVRPSLRTYEVAFGASAGVAREFVLHPDDLVVGVMT
jgi:hypothetical protein